MTTIKLDFEGAFIETQFPLEDHRQSGIYIVYAGKLESDNIYSGRILYIGESENVSLRLTPKEKPEKGLKHEGYPDWVGELSHDEILLFSIADIDPIVRKQAEAAIIYHHYNCRKLELPCNEQNKKTFGYDEKTTINITGDFMILSRNFTVGKDVTAFI